MTKQGLGIAEFFALLMLYAWCLIFKLASLMENLLEIGRSHGDFLRDMFPFGRGDISLEKIRGFIRRPPSLDGILPYMIPDSTELQVAAAITLCMKGRYYLGVTFISVALSLRIPASRVTFRRIALVMVGILGSVIPIMCKKEDGKKIFIRIFIIPEIYMVFLSVLYGLNLLLNRFLPSLAEALNLRLQDNEQKWDMDFYRRHYMFATFSGVMTVVPGSVWRVGVEGSVAVLSFGTHFVSLLGSAFRVEMDNEKGNNTEQQPLIDNSEPEWLPSWLRIG